jgi:hypothetical protein
LKFEARSLKLIARSSWFVEKSIELNVRSLSFAGACQFNPQIKLNFCLDAETSFMFSRDGVPLKLKKEAKPLYISSVHII